MIKDKNVLLNQLALSYSPLCNRDFTQLRGDLDIRTAIEKSSIYVIAQRPVLRFDNLRPNYDDGSLEFEIRQEDNPNVLKCRMPMFQEVLGTDPSRGIDIYGGSNGGPKKPLTIGTFPAHNLHGFKILDVDPDDETQKRFLIWFTPEKLLQNWWNDLVEVDIEGDFRAFTKYKVHYVGKATEQEIWQRLTGHSKLQDILSLENPLCYGSLPTHEIAILTFMFQENMFVRTLGEPSADGDLSNWYLGKDLPEQRTIYLDAEKALIHAMQPAYNEELFKNYPKSTDGLHKHNLDMVNYTLTDPITLVYEKGEIRGGLSPWGGDAIRVTNNTKAEFIKFDNSQ